MTIAVKLSGGLGNQLFQLCFSYSLHLYSSKKVFLDIGMYDSSSRAHFSDLILNPNEVFEIGYFSTGKDISSLFCREHKVKMKTLASKRYQIEKSQSLKVFNENYRQYIPNLHHLDNTYFIGTFASFKYWVSGFKITLDWAKSIMHEMNLLIPESPIYDLSVHARRGDYVNSPKTRAFHGYCGTSYFQEAFRAIKSKDSSIKSVIISSDDFIYANELAKIANRYFTEVSVLKEESALSALLQLSQSRSFIGSNSTFSWWAGYLSPKEARIFPSRWYVSDRINFSTDLLFPDSPILIPIELSR